MATAVSYVSQGTLVIQVFLKYFKQVNGYTLTEDQLYSKILKYDKNQYLHILGGGYVNGLEEDRDRLESAMSDLAEGTKGELPMADSFFQAMQGQINTWNTIKDISSAVGGDLYDGVNAFAQTSLGILKAFNFLLPVLVFGGLGYFIYKNKEIFDLKKLKP